MCCGWIQARVRGLAVGDQPSVRTEQVWLSSWPRRGPSLCQILNPLSGANIETTLESENWSCTVMTVSVVTHGNAASHFEWSLIMAFSTDTELLIHFDQLTYWYLVLFLDKSPSVQLSFRKSMVLFWRLSLDSQWMGDWSAPGCALFPHNALKLKGDGVVWFRVKLHIKQSKPNNNTSHCLSLFTKDPVTIEQK